MLERPEERTARVDRVVEATRFQREKEPQVRVLRCDLPRLGGEAAGLGDRRRAPGASTLHQGERSGDHCHYQRDRDGREQGAQTPGPTSSALEFAVLGVPARLQELAFDRGELTLVARQLDRGRQAWTTVEIGVVASVLLPGARGRGQLPEGSELFSILRKPPAQPRPLTDQRLVGDLGRVVADDQEPGGRKPLDHGIRLLTGSALREQLRQRDAPARVFCRLTQLGELEEHPSHEHLLVLTAAQEDLVGRVSDRPAHAAGRKVARPGQDPTIATGPRLVEGVGEQRKGARFPLHIGQHRVDQAALEPQSRRAGGTLDRLAKLIGSASDRADAGAAASAVARRGWLAQRP